MWQSSPSYQVRLEVFEGPLDLLLQLIQRQELDITRVALAQVTDQYLDYVSRLEEIDPGALVEFLVVAARLLLIKSRALLPQPALVGEIDEDDPVEDLARRLIEYRRFKEAAAELQAREERGLRAYLRVAALPKLDRAFDLEGVSLDDLVAAFRQALALHPVPTAAADLAPHSMTIDDQVNRIMDLLRYQVSLSFNQFLVQAVSRLEIIVSFLALLELIKQKRVVVHQEALFEDILVSRREPADN